MTKITLEIKAKDFYESDYTEANDCAITRAFIRAGYPMLYDSGCGVDVQDKIAEVPTPEGYWAMEDKVMSMYNFATNEIGEKIEPEDFTVTLDFDLSELENVEL